MESRKRFKADINDKYIQSMFDKKRRKRKQRTSLESELPKTNTITSIPSEMLPNSKVSSISSRQREIGKPENWIFPKETKPSRSEVFKVEKNNINNLIKNQQGWRRAARNLEMAITKAKLAPSCHPLVPDEENGNEFSGPSSHSNPIKDSTHIVRKNHSREFLQRFFKTANSIAAKKEATSSKFS